MNKINGVLLVDDDQITNFLNKRIISKLNITNQIQIASDGYEALEYLQKECNNTRHCPELILLDINMPKMDGFEFLEAFEKLSFENKKNVAIAMLSTSTHSKDYEALKKYNVCGFLNKPLTEEKILEVINGNFP